MKKITSLGEAVIYVTMVVVMVLMLLTVSDVFLRYAFSNPITGTTEMTEYLMICMLIGIVPCTLAGRHIRVDAVVQRLRPRVQAILDIILHTAGLGMAVILAWRGYKQSLTVLEFGARSSMLEIPKFPFYVVLIVSFSLLSLALVVILIQTIAKAAKG